MIVKSECMCVCDASKMAVKSALLQMERTVGMEICVPCYLNRFWNSKFHFIAA